MKNFSKPSFRTNLLIWIIIIVIMSISFFFLIYYNLSNNPLNQVVKDNLSNTSKSKAEFVNYWLKNKILLINSVANSVPVNKNISDISSTIKNYNKIYNNFDKISFITSDGKKFYNSNEVNYEDVSNTNYFLAAKNKQSYVLKTRDSKIIISCPIIKNNSFKGVVVGTIKLSKITKLIKPKPFEKIDKILIVDNSGNVFSNIFSISRARMDKYIKKAIKTGHVTTNYSNISDKKVIASYIKLKYNNWVLITETETSQYINAIKKSSMQAAIFTFLLIIFILIPFISYLSRKLTTPLKNIAQATSELAVGNFDKRIYYSSNNEIGLLARSFNSMADTLQNTYNELRKKISDLNSQKEEINLKNTKLEQVVEVNKTILKQLEEKNKQLEQANKVKADFLSIMSHELRTPMNSIIGYTEMLLDGNDGDLSEEQKEDLNTILKSSEKLLNLINDVLDLSKIEAGKMSYTFKKFDLVYEMQNLINDVKIIAQNKGLELFLDYNSNIPKIYSDPVKLNHIVSNLLSNAIKFTNSGYVKLILRTENDDSISISVADTGIGIAKEDINTIFDEFKQVDGSSTRKYEGTGLGLTICKLLTEGLGGNISVSSTPGEGSIFTIKIPISESSKMLDNKQDLVYDEQSVTHNIENNKNTNVDLKELDEKIIVVITKNQNNYKAINSILSEYNFKVIDINYHDAVETIKKVKPDCVFIDIDLPCQNCNDGWLVLLDLNQDKSLINIPKIIMTTLIDNTLGLTLGATDYLAKPFEAQDLLNCIDKCLTPKDKGYVLIVEEDEQNIKLMSKVVKSNTSCSTLVSTSLNDIYRVIESNNKPKLIILNTLLSKINAFDIINTISSLNLESQISIICITEENRNNLENEFLKQHSQTILFKSDLRYSKLAREIKKVVF